MNSACLRPEEVNRYISRSCMIHTVKGPLAQGVLVLSAEEWEGGVRTRPEWGSWEERGVFARLWST